MAHLRKEKDLFRKQREGMISANIPTSAAKVTFPVIDLRNPDRSWFSIAYISFEKYLSIRFFYIAIKELGLFKAESQIHCHRCFSGSAFAACYRDDHFGFVAMSV